MIPLLAGRTFNRGIVGGLLLFALVARFLRTLVIAAVASWIPARRTARLDPADVLRAE
jgi:ABC-type lipoprotein release transport system permease subunit